MELDVPFQSSEEEEEELPLVESCDLTPTSLQVLPPNRRIIALDGTSLTLGYRKDAVIGAIRASLVVSHPEEKDFRIHNYGPYLLHYTNQNRHENYRKIRSEVFPFGSSSYTPSLDAIIDRTRNLLEKKLHLKIVEDYPDSLLLFDGSLTIDPIDNPKSHLKHLQETAISNGSDIVSISKQTILTLRGVERSILSPLEGVSGPCCCDVKPYLSSPRSRYEPFRVFTAKLSRNGEAVRVDIPLHSSREPEELLGEAAGLAGAFGYPEELRIAHIACIFSSLETLELQATAMKKHNLKMGEEIRRKIFGPWG